MTPLPSPLGGPEFIAWRLDEDAHRATWDSGIGAASYGGRWNSAGTRAVYCALDPATAIIEVAVHVGFDNLDRVTRTLTALVITEPANLHVVVPDSVPNPNWLRPGGTSAGQRAFGDALLARHGMFVVPGAVSTFSWNLVFLAGLPNRTYALKAQTRFALDTG